MRGVLRSGDFMSPPRSSRAEDSLFARMQALRDKRLRQPRIIARYLLSAEIAAGAIDARPVTVGCDLEFGNHDKSGHL